MEKKWLICEKNNSGSVFGKVEILFGEDAIMATIFSPLRSLAGGFGKGGDPIKVIEELQANRQPIRLEIENSNLSFYTFIAVRPEFLVIAKPQDIDEDALRIG